MTIVSVKIVIAIKCSFVTETHSKKNLDSAPMFQAHL